MAKLFKLSAYIVDHTGKFDVESLEDFLMWRIQHADPMGDCLDADHIHLTSADIGPWHDDHPINNYNCPEAEYEKYFKEN